MCAAKSHVRFTPNSDIDCAFRHVYIGPKADMASLYSITSSAATSRAGGTGRPRAFAALTLRNLDVVGLTLGSVPQWVALKSKGSTSYSRPLERALDIG